LSSLLGALRVAVIGIVVVAIWDIDAITFFRPVAAVLLVIQAPPPLLLVVGLGLVLILFQGFLAYPSWELTFVLFVPLFVLLALTPLVVALALVVIVVGLPLLLELLDGGLQSHDFLKFWEKGIPGLSLKEAFVLVVCLSHEDVRVEVMSLPILVLFSTNVIAKVLVWDLLVGLEEKSQEVLGDLSSCCQRIN